MTLSLSIYVVDNRGLKVILRKRECWEIKVCDKKDILVLINILLKLNLIFL